MMQLKWLERATVVWVLIPLSAELQPALDEAWIRGISVREVTLEQAEAGDLNL